MDENRAEPELEEGNPEEEDENIVLSDSEDDGNGESPNDESDSEQDEAAEDLQPLVARVGFLDNMNRLAAWHNHGNVIPRFLRRIIRRQRRHVDTDGDGSASSEDESSQNQAAPENISFDQNLPTCHSYLGELEECSGVSYQDRDSFISLPILQVHDFVLIPGQVLPLQITRLNEVSMIRDVMQQPDKTFGVLTTKYALNVHNQGVTFSKVDQEFGCTAEIRSYRDEEEYQIASVRIVAVGRQRFKVMEKRNQLNGNVIAKVKIVSDVELPNMADALNACQRCHKKAVPSEWSNLYKTYHKQMGRMRAVSMSTPWPAWVHKMYDVNFLRMAIFGELRQWNQKLKEDQCPEDSTDFSFWVLKMLPLTDHARLYLLQLEGAVQRLRYILHLLQNRTILKCSECSAVVADRKDVFSMSASGPMAAYVNPGGVVHETLTLYKAKQIEYVGRKSTEHSWFPGYAWTICQCSNCHQHMGWKFTATKSGLTPRVFWGLTRSSVTPQEPEGHDNNESDVESVAASQSKIYMVHGIVL